MGNFIDGIKNFLNGDIDDGEIDEPAEFDRVPEEKPSAAISQRSSYRPAQRDNGVEYNIHATAQLKVILVKPEVYADARQAADHLMNNKTVVLNLESTSPDATRRILDFLGGVVYAQHGSIRPVANNTFIIFPYNVNFEGDEVADALENTGVIF